MAKRELPELLEVQRILECGDGLVEAHVAGDVECRGQRFPLHVIRLGNPDPNVPAVGFFGGFHGLERIGSDVVLAFLASLVSRLKWDSTLHRQLELVRLIFMPVVNPAGMWDGTRANPNGVDLMRNAPLDAAERVPFLLGGHRISAALPWFRGGKDQPMEVENRIVCQLVENELLSRRFSIAIDCHSGFGVFDRIWFPYAFTAQPIEHLPEIHALHEIFSQTHSHHPYVFEPQSRQYLAHGDVWDYLYLGARAEPDRIFLPLTLEMGSWLWVKKNPRQLFSLAGIFNPLILHRQQRVLRRHQTWLEFVVRAASSYLRWLPAGHGRQQHRERALDRWYRSAPA